MIAHFLQLGLHFGNYRAVPALHLNACSAPPPNPASNLDSIPVQIMFECLRATIPHANDNLRESNENTGTRECFDDWAPMVKTHSALSCMRLCREEPRPVREGRAPKPTCIAASAADFPPFVISSNATKLMSLSR